ncbi:hypothetical protein H0G86_011735 [Trichoderma simmonsii]|uniref:Uncharacterized protein n=1 Tax=Trichoderma simmonsii TaxID=1491479 RepID=A0A8G0LMP1_9HYPO|nr:hypothetical protein H0G86_011735 [Trichoderma simmonsii]
MLGMASTLTRAASNHHGAATRWLCFTFTMCNVVFSVVQQKQALGLKLSLLPVEPSTSMAALLLLSPVQFGSRVTTIRNGAGRLHLLVPLASTCRIVSSIFTPKTTKRRRFASALHQASIRSHHLVRLFSCIFTHAFPRGTPQQLDCLRSNSSFSRQYTPAGKPLDVDLCFFLSVAGAHVDSRSLHYMALVSPCSRFAPHVS